MLFVAWSDGRLELPGRSAPCALGRGGVIEAAQKREGDGKTPLGRWPLRRVLYRPDRVEPPRTALPVRPLTPEDGWCDAPDDPAYNRPVRLPYPSSAERMWREDRLYDLICVLGHNDDPPVAGLGSAIFLHLAGPDLGPTEGCVAVNRVDLRTLLALAAPGDALEVRRRPDQSPTDSNPPVRTRDPAPPA